MKVKISDSTMAMSMRSVVRAAYSGRLRGSSDSRLLLQLGQGLEQMAARLAEKHQKAEDTKGQRAHPIG